MCSTRWVASACDGGYSALGVVPCRLSTAPRLRAYHAIEAMEQSINGRFHVPVCVCALRCLGWHRRFVSRNTYQPCRQEILSLCPKLGTAILSPVYTSLVCGRHCQATGSLCLTERPDNLQPHTPQPKTLPLLALTFVTARALRHIPSPKSHLWSTRTHHTKVIVLLLLQSHTFAFRQAGRMTCTSIRLASLLSNKLSPSCSCFGLAAQACCSACCLPPLMGQILSRGLSQDEDLLHGATFCKIPTDAARTELSSAEPRALTEPCLSSTTFRSEVTRQRDVWTLCTRNTRRSTPGWKTFETHAYSSPTTDRHETNLPLARNQHPLDYMPLTTKQKRALDSTCP